MIRSGSRRVVNSVVNSFKMKYDEETEIKKIERLLAHEEKPIPKSRVKRCRRQGNIILHSKFVLLAIVVLNVVDCLLVTGELILDIHYIKGILDDSDLESQKFIDEMQSKYPNSLHGHDIDHLSLFYDEIYQANCSWTNKSDIQDASSVRRKLLAAEEYSGDVNTSEKKAKEAHAHSIWEDISHGMHKASIAILGLLFVECLLKIFFMGKRFFHHKIEVFDAFIVIVSFTLDLVFLKGLTIYRIQDGILVLSFLLPWRVIRVLNSLVVAVLDNEHFRLKMMYKQKKKLAHDLNIEHDKTHKLMDQLRKLEDFLEKEGMPRWKFVHYTHFDEHNSSLASMASFTIRSMTNNFFDGDSHKNGLTTMNNNNHTSPTSMQSNLLNALHNGSDSNSRNTAYVKSERRLSDKTAILSPNHTVTQVNGITNPGYISDQESVGNNTTPNATHTSTTPNATHNNTTAVNTRSNTDQLRQKPYLPNGLNTNNETYKAGTRQTTKTGEEKSDINTNTSGTRPGFYLDNDNVGDPELPNNEIPTERICTRL